MNSLSLFKRKIIYKIKKKIEIDQDVTDDLSLDNLFYKYESDKANIFRIRNDKGHGFSKFYTNYLHNLRNKKLNILEIGSYAGSSAAAFSKYLPNSKVFCFDINISNFKYFSKNIEVFGVDINNINKVKKILQKIFLKNNFENFDLIIDDGSHKLSDILLGLNFFFKYLKNDGIFVIEDYMHPNYYETNRDIDHIFIDELLQNLREKKTFSSSKISFHDQKYLIEKIKEINTFKGNLRDSDICFIKKS